MPDKALIEWIAGRDDADDFITDPEHQTATKAMLSSRVSPGRYADSLGIASEYLNLEYRMGFLDGCFLARYQNERN